MSIKNAWTLLIIATIMVGIMAELLVKSVDDAASEWGMPTLFIGVILLPFFGNAAEHFTAVIVAGKDKMDLSLAIAIGSSVQIAVFVAPLMVLFAWIMGVSLSLEFGLLETAATFMGVLVANFILNDGKTNWLEGAMLLACYVILALSFLLIPFEVGA
jgi:Ca2+:H+ antiporter